MMLPIMACSIISSAVVLERFWSLQRSKVSPENLLPLAMKWAKEGVLDTKRLDSIRDTSPLGRVLAAGLACRDQDRLIMREVIEETGRHANFELNKYLNTLGTIASISPLLGLLGTVIGMIKVFAAITKQGVGDPSVLASGISEALITTGAGLCVAGNAASKSSAAASPEQLNSISTTGSEKCSCPKWSRVHVS